MKNSSLSTGYENKMQILINDNTENLSGQTYIALGSFDGLHKGHMSLINRVVDEALLNECSSLVYTFINHPLSFVTPDKAPKLIMDNDQKIHLLKSAGIDYVAMVEFNGELMKTSPEDFINSLVDKYNARGVVVGFNYRYGYLNKGNVETLKEYGKKIGLEVIVMDPVEDSRGVISSTRIRSLISEGKIEEANELLIEPFMIRGTIIHGKNNGKAMGYPTANMKIDPQMMVPEDGVYYTNVLFDGEVRRGITSVGTNPTISEGLPRTVETYILDFNEDIYGKEVSLYFIERMRDMIKYESLDGLKEQLRMDNNQAALKPMMDVKREE